MDASMTDEKHMSLADIIKRDNAKKKQFPKKGGKLGGIRGKMQAMKANDNFNQGGRPRLFGAGPPRGGKMQ